MAIGAMLLVTAPAFGQGQGAGPQGRNPAAPTGPVPRAPMAIPTSADSGSAPTLPI